MEGSMRKHVMNKYALILAAIFGIVLQGCSTPRTAMYSPSIDNQMTLKKMKVSIKNGVEIGTFADANGTRSVQCRMISIDSPGNKTFSKYIRDAYQAELYLADIYPADDGVTITGTLNDISVSTAGSGHWDISLTLQSSNGQTMNIENSYPFPSAFRADQACTNAAYTFGEAVQDTVNKTLKSGKFRMLIRK